MALWDRFRNLVRGRRLSSELDDELNFHLEMRSRDNVKAGMSEAEAERDARLRFGNFTLEKERTREASILSWLDSLAQDARYTARALRKSGSLSALIVAVLALGIGANTAIFTIVHAVLLRSLPVRDPAHLVNLRLGNFMSWGSIDRDESLTYVQWQELLRRQDVLSEVFAYADGKFDVAVNGGTRELVGAFISPQAFRTLGIEATIGRTFGSEDERNVFSAPTTVISYRLWEREFSANSSAIGRTLLVEGKPFTIVGVAPPRFFGLTVGRVADVYLPLASEPYLHGKDSIFADGLYYWLMVFVRLKPGVTMEQAQARLNALSPPAMRATLPAELPQKEWPQYLKQRFVLDKAAAGLSDVSSTLSLPLRILSAIVALLLVLTCFTVANLLLARATSRRKEIAVRVALGASRGRIVRQLGFESIVLAFAGAFLGLVLSRIPAALLVQAASTRSNPLQLDFALGWTVFGFTCAAATLSAILFGFAPAMKASQVAPADAFKGGSATAASSVLRARRLLLAGQIAVTVVMITGSVLFGATLRNLLSVSTGFRRDGVLIADVDLRRMQVPEKARSSFYAHLLERMKQLPQAESVSLCFLTPISGRTWQIDVHGETTDGWKPMHTYYNAVSSDFFATLGTRVLGGRSFSDRDVQGAPLVAAVNTTFARTVFGNSGAIGRRVKLGDPKTRTVEIVGIVEDAKYKALDREDPPTLYIPLAQSPGQPGSLSVAVRFGGPLARIFHDANTVLSKEYPDLSFRLTTLREQIDDSVVHERTFALVCGLFGSLALCLAAVGIFGVLSYFVEQRRSEFSIRMTLGATAVDIRRLIYGQSLSTFAAGGALGCLVAVWSAKFVSSMLYGVTAAQPGVYAVAIGIVAAVALIATVVPALRASRRQDLRILQSE